MTGPVQSPDSGRGIKSEIKALRDRLDLVWTNHEREHTQHELAHGREHEFAQKAIETAALLAKENKSDANEWRQAMNDRERTFATKVDIATIAAKIDNLETAEIKRAEQEKIKTAQETKDKQAADDRVRRSQWVIGLTVGLLATFGAILINLVIRLAGPGS